MLFFPSPFARKSGTRFDILLFAVLLGALITNRVSPVTWNADLLMFASVAGIIPVAASAIRAFAARKVSIDLLASVALIASFFAQEWHSAAFINLMLTAARIFAAYTEARARSAITGILKLRPEKVRIRRGQTIEDIPLSAVRVGDAVIIESGEHIAVDGTVDEGSGAADQSSLTGESVPIAKNPSDKVWGGTLLVAGSITVRTEKVGKDTTIEKTIALVENAVKEKAGIHTLADRFAAWYIALVLIGAGTVYFVFHDLSLLLSLLLVACADDIAVATPMGLLAAVSRAARRGVIVKGGAYLETIARADTLIVDKTGTLTRGRFAVKEVRTSRTHSESELFRAGAVTSAYSHHPVSQAIAAYLKSRKIPFEKPERVEEFPGKGITAFVGGRAVRSGSIHFIEESGVMIPDEVRRMVDEFEDTGLNANAVSSDRELIGIFACADEVRPEMPRALRRLETLGIRNIAMLTGDNEKVAARVAKEVGIREFHANMLPDQKLSFIRARTGRKKKVIMAGDGINDAAALALADVGVSMGTIGSDAAIEASDIALMKDDFERIPETIELGRKVMHIIRENFAIWGIVNVAGLALVAMKVLGPEGASAYNFLTDFIPIANASRLFGGRGRLLSRIMRRS